MKEFLEKRWWQGVVGIVGIIALVIGILKWQGIVRISGLAISIALNIIFATVLVVLAIWATRWKRKYEVASSRVEEARRLAEKATEAQKKLTERKRVLLSDPNYIWRLNIDNTLLTKLCGQAHGLAITKFHDAKLNGLSIIVDPYQKGSKVSILFSFYSQWADRECTYSLSETKDMEELRPSTPVRFEGERVTFDELPWLRNPDWLQFLRKSCEKVGPLSPASWTGYHVSAYPEGLHWDVSFRDGVTGEEFWFSWDGKGEPIQGEKFG